MNWHNFIFSNDAGDRTKRHLAFWLLWWLYFAATYYFYVQVGLQRIAFGNLSSILLLKTFLLVIVHMIACYVFIYLLLPQNLLHPQYFSFIGGIAILTIFLLAAGYFIHLNIFPLLDRAYQNNLAATNSNIWWTSINSVLLTAPKIIAAATAIKLVKRWYLKQKEKEKIEKEKLITDLKLLKAQVHPGFLFSSLDHIYNYAKLRSPKAQELLLKFSDLLSYLLYECDDAKVLLEKELTMMEEYMAIEKIRFNNNLEMEMVIKGEAGINKIAPLILLPFIENSFRQCNYDTVQPWINIEMNIDDKILTMKLINGVEIDASGEITRPEEIINVRKRLELVYPGQHELKIYTEEEICVTFLKIYLN
jgi:sensor histidine kinase YesM